MHVAVRFLLWRASLARGDWAGLVLTSCLYYFCYGALYKSAGAVEVITSAPCHCLHACCFACASAP